MAMFTFMLSRPSTRSVALGAAVFLAGDGFGSQSFVEKKFSDATDAWIFIVGLVKCAPVSCHASVLRALNPGAHAVGG